MVKCMDEIDSKTIMLNEIHMSMDQSYKMDEIFGWKSNNNELFGWNFHPFWNVWMKLIPK
jgi:hypothetical protein